MKNTSVTPSATFDNTPRPNHTAKIGARITRGIALSAVMYGSAMADAVGVSASHKPIPRPRMLPAANARTVSHNVIARCG